MAVKKAEVRLASLYAVMERIRSAELRDSMIAVDGVACSAAVAKASREERISAGRTAMAAGSRADWEIAETTRGVVETQMIHLAKLRREREAALSVTAAEYRLSRLSKEQMDRVVEQRRLREATKDDKQSQAELDDRFASRRVWMNLKASERSE